MSPARWRVPANGIELAVHDWGGSGDPVLLLHANSFHARQWDPIAIALRDGFRLIAVDLRGHGDSDKPTTGYRRDDLAADLTDLIAALDLTRPQVIAHSLGGITALVAGGKQPGLIGRTVLVEPVLRSPEFVAPPGPRTGGMIERARKRRMVWPSRQELLDSYRRRQPFNTWRAEILEAYVTHGVFDRSDGQVELKCPGEAEAQVYLNGYLTDEWHWIDRFTAPTLILRGDRSHSLHQPLAETLLRRLPRARLAVVPDTSHYLPMEQPDLVSALARAFLTSEAGWLGSAP